MRAGDGCSPTCAVEVSRLVAESITITLPTTTAIYDDEGCDFPAIPIALAPLRLAPDDSVFKIEISADDRDRASLHVSHAPIGAEGARAGCVSTGDVIEFESGNAVVSGPPGAEIELIVNAAAVP